MSRVVVLINGAPRSGKDTLAQPLLEKYGFSKYKFTAPIDNTIKTLFNLSDEDFNRLREVEKDVPQEVFNGLTMRKVLIDLSEDFVKPRFGKDFFGRIGADVVNKYSSSRVVVTDCGFGYEVQAFLDGLTKGTKVVGINTYREGYTFENDSRHLVRFENSIFNTGSVQDLQDAGIKLLTKCDILK